MSLRELRAVRSENERAVRILRDVKIQRFQNQNLPERICQVLLSPDDGCDTHQCIINRDAEVVHRNSSAPQQDEVTDSSIRVPFYSASDDIINTDHGIIRDLEADRIGFAGIYPALNFLGVCISPSAVILRRPALGFGLLALLFEFLLGAEAGVRQSLLEETVCKLDVNGLAFGLAVRSKAATVLVWPLIESDTQPIQIFDDRSLGFPRRTRKVRIFDAQDSFSPLVFCMEPVVQRCAGTTHM
mmetsp:Transcript_8207/g.24699  ORF Transcript_8207/g.24699 Transcript_8207/m.24699 type:complete len:243 (-) Transcript_8207:348-1076(-)